jgi:Phage protein (N4 Gp49/phage Sf6 gene 66) family
MNDQDVENEIQAKGLTAARVTPAMIEAAIMGETYTILPSGRATICEMTLKNGYVVIGQSLCVCRENFNLELGQKIAREDAKQKIWALEGYLLRQKLFAQPQPMAA